MGRLALTGNSRTRSRLAVLPTATATLPFTDDFNRSDRSLNGDNGWTANNAGFGTINIVSNQVVCAGVSNGCWSKNTSNGVSASNHYAQIKVASGLSGDIGGPLVRYTDNNNFYVGRCNAASGGHVYELYKRVGGTYTLINSLNEAFASEPFLVKLEVNGTSLIFSLWNGSSWVSKVTGTDSAFSTGAPGWYSQTVTGDITYDDYEHGNT